MKARTHSAASVYRSVQGSGLVGRELEAHALRRAALLLERAAQRWDEDDHERRLAEALLFTERLWAVLRSAWLAADCPLPEDQRRVALTLAHTVGRRIAAARAAPAPAALALPIRVQRELADGLATGIETLDRESPLG